MRGNKKSPEYMNGYQAGYAAAKKTTSNNKACWILKNKKWYCSGCNTEMSQDHYEYCSKCGRKMSEVTVLK